MSAKKGKDKRSAKTGAKEIPSYDVDITLEVLEIGNMASSETRFFMDANFMEKALIKDRPNIFEACHCGPVDVLNFKWTLPLKIKGEENIVDLSANPIVVNWSKLTTEYDQDVPKSLMPEHLTQQGLAFIELAEIITNKVEDVRKTTQFQAIQKQRGADLKTWPNVPFIRYRLATSKPIVRDENTKYNTISFTFECGVNLSNDLLMQGCCSYEIGLVLSLSKDISRNIVCKQGKLLKPDEIPKQKVYCTLSHFNHQAKLTSYNTNSSYTPNEIDYSIDTCKIQGELLENCEKFVSFYGIYKCMITHETLKRLINLGHLAIEVYVKKEGTPHHLLGIVNLISFSFVGITKIRTLVPLQKFNLSLLLANSGHDKIIFSTGPQGKQSPMKTKQAKSPKSAKSVKTDNSMQTLDEFITNEEGYTTCVAVEIEIDSPLISRKLDVFNKAQIERIETPQVHRTRSVHTDKELEFFFKREIGTFIRLIESKGQSFDAFGSIDKLCLVSNEGDLFGAAAVVLSKKFNFAEATDAESTQHILEYSYIYLVNKIHEVLFRDSSNPREEVPDVDFRELCALECYELDMLDDARDFYIMNIRDTRDKPFHFVLYAIYSLLTGDMQMCLECCLDALKRDPKCYICYLLQSYVAFVYKDIKCAEEILRRLTKICENFAEAWMALFVLHLQEDKKADMIFAQQNVYLAHEHPYTTAFHNKREIIWTPTKGNDPRLNSIITFIQWGCLDFAEIGLAALIHEYGCKSYVYLYYMALIDYYKKNYLSALQRLGSIKNGTARQLCLKMKLRVHCLLKMESLTAVSHIKDFLHIAAQKNIDEQLNLMQLKVGSIYLTLKKYKTASFYLKQCCHRFRTFAAYALLGKATFQCQCYENAESCFKVAYNINPFNKISWAYLAIIYFRKNLIPQFKLCKTNAEKQNRLDNKLAEELQRLDLALEQRKRNKVCDFAKNTMETRRGIM